MESINKIKLPKYLNSHQQKFAEVNNEIESNRRPEWLKVKIPSGKNYFQLKDLIIKKSLNTVCEDARCPNIAECWSRRTATFMILGNVCTRSCGFCSVTLGKPNQLDYDEPNRVADAVRTLGLKHAVITSVNRDDQFLGGADIFAMTISEIRKLSPDCKIEVLIPDFKGNWLALDLVINAKPDIINHNIETVKKLYHFVRPQADYKRTLNLLHIAKEKGFVTKSGLMAGLGETNEEIFELLKDLSNIKCDIVTIGQYLRPTKEHLPVQRWVTPSEFNKFKSYALSLGFKHVESGPLVRSSYHADKQTVFT